ncbi:glycoside hydrolase family 108 protein [Paraburkholderia sp. MM6662-R1]|uniref:glycoside hydrolase family 108 protein n=1 Tax=Paraburkholderia sp. MM6662-R1 TaxID=2991066 RepID=UPI003D1BD71B
MDTFPDAFAKLINVEQGLSMDPTDRGNWTSGKVGVGQLKGTKYGVSAMSYPTLDIANLALDDAQAIYRRDYWNKVHADQLPSVVAFQVFDAAVNSGVSQAAKWLQKSVGATPDGVIGNLTLAAVSALAPAVITGRFNAYRLIDMTDMAGWPMNSRGWAKRVGNNLLMGLA